MRTDYAALTEQWKPVLGGFYDVSSIGRIRRMAPGHGTQIGRILRPSRIHSGHLCFTACTCNKSRRILIHVLVAQEFIGPCPPGKEINHKDWNPANNAVGNLEYITHAENIKHGFSNKSGELLPYSKLKNCEVSEIRRLRAAGVAGRELARRFKISEQTICDITKLRRRVAETR